MSNVFVIFCQGVFEPEGVGFFHSKFFERLIIIHPFSNELCFGNQSSEGAKRMLKFITEQDLKCFSLGRYRVQNFFSRVRRWGMLTFFYPFFMTYILRHPLLVYEFQLRIEIVIGVRVPVCLFTTIRNTVQRNNCRICKTGMNVPYCVVIYEKFDEKVNFQNDDF